MSASPFASRGVSVPVFVVTDPMLLAMLSVERGTAVVRPEATGHQHPVGNTCVVCESRGNVRVLLFELGAKQRLGLVAPFERVVVDATGHDDPAAIADALVPGRQPALGLRDHAVARNFRLASYRGGEAAG